MHATLQQLRLFEAVARLGSVTRAAGEANLTQPAVSIQLKRLEEQAGMALFDQVGRRLLLTAAGRELLSASQNILREMAELGDALESLRGEIAGPVRVSAVTTATYFMPHLLGEFVRRHPKVQPILTVTNRSNILNRLENRQDDVYIMGQVPEHLDVSDKPFLENVLVVAAHPSHPLTGAKRVKLADLARERILVREPGSGTRQAIDRLLFEHGLEITPYMELGSGEAIKQGVMAGLGLAVLSRQSLALEIASGRVAVIDCEPFPLRRPWNAVYPRSGNQPLAVRTFLEFLAAESARVIKGTEAAPSAKPKADATMGDNR